jgi:hypothetical protein
MPRIKIIVAISAAKRQIEMGMHINPARQQIFTRAINDFMPIWRNILPNQRNDFAFYQYIGFGHIAGGNDCAMFKKNAHKRLSFGQNG